MVVRACRLLLTDGEPASIISLRMNDIRGIS